MTGLRPEISGVLTRTAGRSRRSSPLGSDRRADRRDRAGARVRAAAMAAGRHVVTANKQLLSHHGEELWEAAREHGVQLRFEGAVAGVVPVIRVLQESLAGATIDRVHGIVNGTTNFILTEMARTGRDLRRGARRRPAARLRRGRPLRGRRRPRRGRQDGDPRAARVRHPGAHRPGPLRGDRAHPARRPRVRARARARAEADRHRRADRRRRCRSASTPPSSTRAIRSRRSTARSTRSRSSPRRSPRSRCPGPGAGGPQTASAVLGDVISAMIPPASTPPTTERLEIVHDVVSSFYLHLEVADEPGVLAQVAQVLALQDVSVKSVVQKGLRRPGAAGDGRPSRARVALRRRYGSDRRPGFHARPAAGDPRDRGGVRR